jgi:DNA repair protein RecO (recombination protein O)
MEWSDEGVVLSARKHGEAAAIVHLLTRAHGRHAGLVRGGAGRKSRGVLQPGNEVDARWRARLAEHLGTYTVELKRSRASVLMDDALRLAGLSAACAVAQSALPEREPHASLYEGFRALLDAMEQSPAWAAVYVRWEVELLKELGFGLDLSQCAATGVRDDLAYVSPRSGRAVSAGAAAPYRGKLLKLPGFLLASQGGAAGADEIADGLALTGFFLERHVLAPAKLRPPAARARLVERIVRATTTSGDISDP